MRFDREAKTRGAHQHPHIAQTDGFEQSGLVGLNAASDRITSGLTQFWRPSVFFLS
jgi:hypothetical protein